MEELNAFIGSNPDSRELKRALAVRMTLQGYKHQDIQKILQVSSGFISTWKQRFIMNGVPGLKLGYQGSKGYLTPQEKQEILEWIKNQNIWTLNELEYQIAFKFGVTFASKTSYYDLFHEAGVSWKKSQKKNPGKNEEAVADKKKEIEEYLESNREGIESGKIVVLFADECHLMWGDVCGYVWGRTDQRIKIPMTNEKQRQTYYGAINYRTGKVFLKDYPQGNTENSIKFVKNLRREYKEAEKIVIFWDGASYHKSQEFREYLKEVNQDKTEEEWAIKCVRLAPNAPEQNPIEDVWLQGKETLRKYWKFSKNFHVVKWLFEWAITQEAFLFPKLSMYGDFS
jgi:putative transposase